MLLEFFGFCFSKNISLDLICIEWDVGIWWFLVDVVILVVD